MVRLYFEIPGPNNDELQNQDGELGGNSDAVITYTLPNTGPYRINARRVNGPNGMTTGDYKLTLTCGCPKLGGDIVWEGEIRGKYKNRVTTSRGDIWAFRAYSRDRIQLRLEASGFTPVFNLYGYEAEDLIRLSTGVVWIPPTPEPGEYVIESKYRIYEINQTLNRGCYYVWVHATSDSVWKTGDYFLELKRMQ
jgi:hypothetical protein